MRESERDLEVLQESVLPEITPIRRFKPYQAYKDSGIEWLGEIPAHWETERLKYLAALNPESLTEDTDSLHELIYVDIGSVNDLGRILQCENLTFGTAPSRARRIVRSGDVIVSTVRTYLRAITSIGDAQDGFIVSTGFAVVRPKQEFKSQFAHYALRSPYFIERVVANSYGVSFPATSETEIATYEIALPPEHEQNQIGSFLSRETAKIDALVAKKERLIELLQEKRATLISHAVTRGVDPNVPMKDSDVEWLGEIPAYWEMLRLKLIAKFVGGGTPTKANLEYWIGDIPWVSPKDMKKEVINDTEDKITLEAIRNSATSVVPAGSVLLVVRSGILIHSIPVALAGRDVTLNQDMKAIIPDERIAGPYLTYLIRGSEQQLLVEWKKEGATVESLEFELIVNTRFPVPPFHEQGEIVRFLDAETTRISALIARVKEGIDSLLQYRTALISAAVTGKIDVREEVKA